MKTIKQVIKSFILTLLVHFLPKMKFVGNDKEVGISTFICHDDVNRFICAASSLFYFLNKTLPIYITHDGTVTSSDIKKLSHLFTIVIEKNNKKRMLSLIRNAKCFERYRFNPKAPVNKIKFDALLLSPFEKTIYLDSDILFFQEPKEIASFTTSSEIQLLYNSRPEKAFENFPFLLEYENYPLRKILRSYLSNKKLTHSDHGKTIFFNSGLLCIPHKSISISKLEAIFRIFENLKFEQDYLAEEIALSLITDSIPSKTLSQNKYCVVSDWPEYQSLNRSKTVAIHYAADRGMKNRNSTDAIQLLFKYRFFRA